MVVRSVPDDEKLQSRSRGIGRAEDALRRWRCEDSAGAASSFEIKIHRRQRTYPFSRSLTIPSRKRISSLASVNTDKFAGVGEFIRFHEALLFLRAYPASVEEIVRLREN